MGMIWFLKALGDISAYYLFAAPVAAYFGESSLLLCALLQAIAYATARSSRRKWLLIPTLGLLAACVWLCRESPADLVALLPSTGYLLWQFLRKQPVPELTQQRDIFEGSWKLFLGAAAVALLISQLFALLPFVLLALAAHITLLRTLRHSPTVYLRPGFQLMNLGAVAIVPAGALLLGTGPVWAAVSGGISWIYQNVLLPLLMGLLWLPGKAIQWLINLLKPIFDIEPDNPDSTQPMEATQATADAAIGDLGRVKNTSQIMQLLLLTLLAVAAVIGMILLFRKLSRKSAPSATTQAATETRATVADSRYPTPDKGDPSVQAVRKHYRRFLKLYRKEGLPLEKSTTSGDIHDAAKDHSRLGIHSGRIRQLYIRARYGAYAGKEDVKEMGRLCSETKKRT